MIVSMSYVRNTISKLYVPVSSSVAPTRDALAKRLQSVYDIAQLLYQKPKEKLGYGQKLKDTVKNEVEQEAKNSMKIM